MNKYRNYEQGHAFLIQKFDALDAFTKEELEDACGWPKDKDT